MKEACGSKQFTGLQFFGKVTASATHDLKNALAIINENAGLFVDYVGMARRGAPIDPDRIETLAGRILNQVKRADALLKSLNRFAHSVDDPIASVDLNEFLVVSAALAARPAAMRGVTLKAEAADGPLTTATAPFLLLKALFACIEQASQLAGKGQSLNLKAAKSDPGFRIDIGPLTGLPPGTSPPPGMQGEEVAALLKDLKAEVVFDVDRGMIALLLSDRQTPREPSDQK